MLLLFGVTAIRRVPSPFPAILAICLAGSVAGCDREKQPDGQAGVRQAKVSEPQAKDAGVARFAHQVVRRHKGRAAPGAVFAGPDDAPLTLAAFRGRPLLVNLWATWCAPCVAEMPTLDKLAAARAETLMVIAVAQDRQGAEVVDPWFQTAGLTTLQPYLDPDNGLLTAFNSALPTTIYYDAEGRELWRVVGALDWQGEEAAALLAEAAPR